MDWKKKLTSRKFWVALAGLVVGVIALLGIKTDTSQITGVIMALGSVVAYIVGEGLVDAAATGTSNSTTLTVAPVTPVIGTVDTGAAGQTQTAADLAAEVKTETGLSGKDGATSSSISNLL